MEIYLDNCATTKVCPQAAEACMTAMVEAYGNPSSLHKKGLEAEHLVTRTRKIAAGLLGCDSSSIIFTGGATDSNNIAILGGIAARARRGKTIVTSAVEHPSVSRTLDALAEQGYTIRRISPKPDGNFSAADFVDAIDEDTVMLTFMMVNNEMGTILPYDKIIPAARKKSPDLLIHMDGVQGFTKLPLQVRRLDLDLFSFSGHKLYAPKGIGGLYIKKGVRILPVEHGGGQEQGIRSGTLSVPLIAALGEALTLCQEQRSAILENYRQRQTQLRERLSHMPEVVINSPENCCPHLLNLSVPGIPSEIMLHTLEEKGIYVSSGSACAGGALSETLAAYGLPPERIRSALRISFSRETTAEEIDIFADQLAAAIQRLSRVIGR